MAWTSPAPALRVVSLGTPRERVVSVGTLAKSAYAINVMFWLTHACTYPVRAVL